MNTLNRLWPLIEEDARGDWVDIDRPTWWRRVWTWLVR